MKLTIERIVVFMFLFGLLLTSCVDDDDSTNGSNPSTAETDSNAVSYYKKITAEEAYQMMMEAGEDKYILLDVRGESEYKNEHIVGATLIPNNEIGSRAEIELPDKNALILIYCRSGRRSANSAQELVSMGYTNVFDFGGISDWPYETVKG